LHPSDRCSSRFSPFNERAPVEAAVLTGPQSIEIRHLPDPAAPSDGLILKVEACGICGSDVRRWKEGPSKDAGAVTPGHEVSGSVLEVGSAARDFRVGERLAVGPDIHCGRCYYCRRGMYNLCDNLRFLGITPGHPGGFAEKLVLTRDTLTNGIVHRMPADLSYVEGALAEPCSSVLTCHEKARTGSDDTVVVPGAGPIGCLHVSLAKARGARVIVSEPSESRRRLVSRFQPDVVVNPESEDAVARVRDLTDGLGADIVICANPVAATHQQAVEMVRKGGRVVLFGGLPKANPMTALDANRIHYGEIEVVGSFSYQPVAHERALELLRRKQIPSDLLITHRFPLERIAEAFKVASSGESLKVMIVTSREYL